MAYVEYFEKTGVDNTERVLDLVAQRARELGIKRIVVATSFGETGIRASQALKDFEIIVVTHSTGLRSPDQQGVTPDKREQMIANGAKVLTCTHTFGGIGRAVRRKFATYELEELIAYTLRIFGQGCKVACEITMMAADAGLVRTDEEIITVTGTSRGADTAFVIQPAHAQDFFNLRVREIICKPR